MGQFTSQSCNHEITDHIDSQFQKKQHVPEGEKQHIGKLMARCSSRSTTRLHAHFTGKQDRMQHIAKTSSTRMWPHMAHCAIPNIMECNMQRICSKAPHAKERRHRYRQMHGPHNATLHGAFSTNFQMLRRMSRQNDT